MRVDESFDDIGIYNDDDKNFYKSNSKKDMMWQIFIGYQIYW